MPTFFVIGAAKCGTTSLHGYLDRHPEISMSKVKEPMYFTPPALRDVWPHSEVAKTRDQYLELFDREAPIRGESSTAYTMDPIWPGVAEAIHAEVPDARLVYVVRDPMDRVLSAWVEMNSGRNKERPPRRGLILDREIFGDFDDPSNYYTWPGMYMTQLERYLRLFPERSIKIVDSNDLRLNREATMCEIFAFLGADADFTHPEFAREENSLAIKTVEGLPYIRMSNSRSLRRLVDLLPASTREWAVETVRRPFLSPAAKPTLDPGLRRALEDHFRPEVNALREFTGRSFSSWSI